MGIQSREGDLTVTNHHTERNGQKRPEFGF